MKTVKYLVLFTTFFVFSCNQKKEAKDLYADAIQQSRIMIDSLLAAGTTPGIDVAVAVHGELIWSEGFGFMDVEQKVPVRPGESRFRIGSVSKPLTSAALGRLMDQGLIDINREVQDYVPYFPDKVYPLSVKQVAGHLGGIRHYRNLEFMMAEHFETVEDGISIFKDDSLLFEPGSRFSYSSYGYNLVSAAIEGASGKNFLKVMQEEVFDPLGMISTCADKNDSIIMNRASFYAHNGDGELINAPYVDNSYKWAGGGFISTTTDLVKFGLAHSMPGYLSDATLHELTCPMKFNDGTESNYGVGWFTGESHGHPRISHGGGSIGGITDFVILPDEEMVFVLLSNSSDTRYGNVMSRMISLFLEADDHD